MNEKNRNSYGIGTFVTIFILLFAYFTPIYAQDNTSTVTGKVIDSQDGTSLPNSTVMLMSSDTARMVSGGITDKNGSYKLSKISKGKYILKVSFIGYKTFYHAITVNDGTNNAGTAMLTPSSVEIETTLVEAKLPEMEVKDDTLMFNASAFKVPEGSVLEELLKKLPGVEIDSEGTIKVNGKTVSRILVGGKEFFGNNKEMATKNIPTEIIDKVKTYDKQSDMARITGIDDGEEETVIDISVKKNMNHGWFGNLDTAYGTKDRFSEKLMVNRFSDKSQASLIGSYNNVGDRNFPGGGGGPGGRGGGGIRKSGMGGLNFAQDAKNIEYGGNIQYSGSKNDSRSRSNSQNFVSTNASYSNNRNINISKSNNFRGDFKIEWTPDTLTRLLLRPSFSFGDNKSNSEGVSATFNDDPYADGIGDPLSQIDELEKAIRVNKNTTESMSSGDSKQFGASMILNCRLNNRGRSLTLNASGNYSSSESKSHSMSDVIYYQRNDSTSLTYRYRSTPSSNKSVNVGLNYSEPILKNLFLMLNYKFEYSKRHSDGKTYDLSYYDGIRDSILSHSIGYKPYDYTDYLNDDLSRYTDNENYVHTVDLQLRLITSKLLMNVGVTFNPQHQKVKYDYQGLDTIASRDFSRISPTLNLRYRFSKQHQIRVRYRGNTSQPNITDMFNNVDNSDPLNIRMGNPSLKPSFTNNFSVEYNNYIQDYNRNITASARFNNTLNSISQRTEYNDETGGRITRPENINGNWSASGNFGFSTPLFVSDLKINTNSSCSYNNSVGFIYKDQETLKNTVKNLSLGERLSLTLNKDDYDITLTGSLNYNQARSNLIETTNRDTYDFNYGLSFNVRPITSLSISSNIGMSSRRGYSSAEMNTNELIWNAQIAYSFLKRKQATISLQAYDILANRSNISRMISATSRSDSETNAINSYAMVHFIYKLNMFGGRQMGGNRGGRNFDRPMRPMM